MLQFFNCQELTMSALTRDTFYSIAGFSAISLFLNAVFKAALTLLKYEPAEFLLSLVKPLPFLTLHVNKYSLKDSKNLSSTVLCWSFSDTESEIS